MKKVLFCFVMLMSVGLCLIGCSSDEANDEAIAPVDFGLCHTWQIVGYGSDQDFHVGDGVHDVISARITFNTDGTYNSFANSNSGSGKYVCKDNQLFIAEYHATKSMTDNPVDWFVEETFFHNHTSYRNFIVSDTELRIYYEGDQYFKFYRKE